MKNNILKPVVAAKTQHARIAISVMLTMVCASTFAGSVAGFGGSTEITQIMNNIQLVNAYQQQVQQFVRQGQQFEAQLRNMEKNPSSVLSGDANAMINNIGRIMAAGQAMGGSLAQIDKTFANKFGNQTAATYSENFSSWTNTSKDTLQGAMRSAGMRRDQYASDAAALAALYNESQATGGTVSAVQTLSKINVKQVEQMQALGDLMATQNIASSTYMAAQASKSQATRDQQDMLGAPFTPPVPPIQKATTVKWTDVLYK